MFGIFPRPPSRRVVFIALGIVSFMWAPLFAQYAVPQDVLGNGGADLHSPSYGVRGTIGQPGIGTASSSSTTAFVGYWYNPGTTVTSIGDRPEPPPVVFGLDQNYPNPFNPSTTIRFSLPRPTHVTLKVYDVSGALVATVVDREMKRGVHKEVFDASRLATGIYFYRLQAAGFTQTRKLILLK